MVARNITAPVAAWIKSLSPRQHGLAIAFCAMLLVTANLAIVRGAGDYFPALFPIAGFILPMGLFMLVSGYGRDDFAARRVPRATAVALFVVMLLGIGGGLYANVVLFGRAWR